MPEMLVYATAANADEAKKIAFLLVDQKLAACVNILPEARSVYRWEGKVQEAGEIVMIIKTTDARLKDLEKTFLSLHSYTCPALVAVPIEKGFDKYLEWIRDNTRHDA